MRFRTGAKSCALRAHDCALDQWIRAIESGFLFRNPIHWIQYQRQNHHIPLFPVTTRDQPTFLTTGKITLVTSECVNGDHGPSTGVIELKVNITGPTSDFLERTLEIIPPPNTG